MRPVRRHFTASAAQRADAFEYGQSAPARIDVVHVLPHARTLGGSERAVLDLLASPELEEVRQRVAFVQAGPARSFPRELVLSAGGLGWHPLAVVAAIARARPRVIHGWLLQGNLVGALAQLASPSSKLVTSERNVGDELTAPKRLLECLVAARESVATANSKAVCRAALGRLPRRGRTMRVISPGIARPCRPSEVISTSVVMVGRLDPVKDYASALHAWQEVAREDSSLRLTIVGDGPQREPLEALADSLGIGGTVAFVGDRDPHPYLFGARVFLQSSLAEGFSRALLEALIVGLPVVVTEVGGVREVRDGVLRIVPCQDSTALARELSALLADDDAQRRARLAAPLIASQFDPSRCSRSYRELYRELGVV
jgi:glycosyltransferase involved in cell wall biosynthesis